MDTTDYRAYDKTRDLSRKACRSSCYAPHTTLSFFVTGDALPCCDNHTYSLGNITKQSIREIWDGARIKALRRALEGYNFRLGCEGCGWQIRGGDYQNVLTRHFDRMPLSEGLQWPTAMQFFLSNACNLACIMCHGTLSSTIRSKRENLPPLPKVYGDEFFEELRDFLPHLKQIEFYGGEPFVSRENYRIWDMMREMGISVPVTITTNGTVYNQRIEQILRSFPVRLNVSMDGISKETVESIRVNVRFETLLENVNRFHALAQSHEDMTLAVTYCLMRRNWHEFGDFLRFAESLDVDAVVNTVIEPGHCSIYTLPPEEILDIARRMEASGVTETLTRHRRLWQHHIEKLRGNATSRQVSEVTEIHRTRHEKHFLVRAWKLVGEGRLEDALRVVEKVAETDPDYYSVLILRAHVHRTTSRSDQAAQVLQTAIDLHPKGAHAYIERAWLHLEDSPVAALEDARKAHARASNSDNGTLASASDVLSVAARVNGLFDSSVAAAGEAIALQPTNGWYHLHYAEALVAASRPKEAIQVIDRAIALPDQSPDLRKLLADGKAQLS